MCYCLCRSEAFSLVRRLNGVRIAKEIPGETVIRYLCSVMLLFGATAIRADVFDFSYSGGGVNASGMLTATALGLGSYQINTISGSRNSSAITGLVSGVSFFYNSPSLTSGSFTFDIGPTVVDNVSFLDGTAQETLYTSPFSFKETSVSFSINKASVPEPSALLLLLTMGFGFWALARILPSKKTQ